MATHFLVKLRVVQRDGGLAGDDGDERQVGGVEDILGVVLRDHHADQVIAADERHIQRRTGTFFFTECEAPACDEIDIDEQRLPTLEHGQDRAFVDGHGWKRAGVRFHAIDDGKSASDQL